MAEIHFQDMIGENVLVYTRIAQLGRRKINGQMAAAKVTGVESGGIWIEHEGMAEDISQTFGVRISELPKANTQIFLPFASILWAAYLSPKLDEESFGVQGSE